MPGKNDPWLAHEPVPGVSFEDNSTIAITTGPHAGKRGWLVALIPFADPLYTVELETGEGDVDVPQSQLRLAT